MGLFSRKKALKKKSEVHEPNTVEPQSDIIKHSPKTKIKLSYQFANLQDIGKRSQQEDSFGFVNVADVTEILKKGFMAIVADGMGGMKDGSFASKTAVSVLRSVFEFLDYEADIPSQLNTAMLDASRQIYGDLGAEGGSTAIACLFYDEEMYYSSIGDSFLMLKRDNQLFRINRPHTVRHKEYYSDVLRGSANPLFGNSADQKNALTNYLGAEECDDIDYFVKAMPLNDGDVIMICSDGVAGVLSENCMLSCLSLNTPLQMCNELDKCIKELDLPNQDNYTAIVIKCEY